MNQALEILITSASYVFHRLSKELVMYEKEVTDGEAKLVQMKESGQDAYDIKKYVSYSNCPI